MSDTANDRVCPICGSKALVRKVRMYHYTQSGLNNVYLSNSVYRITCPAHGEILKVPNEQQVLQVIALELLAKAAPLNPKEMLFLRKSCDLTQSAMAKLLGLRGHATVAERESGKSRVSVESDFYFRAKVARHLLDFHLQRPLDSFLAPVHMDRLRLILESFTDLVLSKGTLGQTTLTLVLDHQAWRGRAA